MRACVTHGHAPPQHARSELDHVPFRPTFFFSACSRANRGRLLCTQKHVAERGGGGAPPSPAVLADLTQDAPCHLTSRTTLLSPQIFFEEQMFNFFRGLGDDDTKATRNNVREMEVLQDLIEGRFPPVGAF